MYISYIIHLLPRRTTLFPYTTLFRSYRKRAAFDRRIPSIREAWFSSSEMIASSGPNSGPNTAPLASKQEENRIVASVPRNLETASSNSRCRSWVPQMKRTERSEEHTSELQSRGHLVCRPLLEKKTKHQNHLQK